MRSVKEKLKINIGGLPVNREWRCQS